MEEQTISVILSSGRVAHYWPEDGTHFARMLITDAECKVFWGAYLGLAAIKKVNLYSSRSEVVPLMDFSIEDLDCSMLQTAFGVNITNPRLLGLQITADDVREYSGACGDRVYYYYSTGIADPNAGYRTWQSLQAPLLFYLGNHISSEGMARARTTWSNGKSAKKTGTKDERKKYGYNQPGSRLYAILRKMKDYLKLDEDTVNMVSCI